MNSVPTILTQDGFKVDNNGLLTELVIPHTVDTLKGPTKIVFNEDTLNWIPSTAAALQEFVAPNCTTVNANIFKSYTVLTTLDLRSLQAISESGGNAGLCYGCTRLTSVNLSSVETIAVTANTQSKKTGTFIGCTSLTSISLPALTSLSVNVTSGGTTSAYTIGGAFNGCTELTAINLPNLTTLSATAVDAWNISSGSFYGCTGLTTVNLPELRTVSSTGGGSNKTTTCIGSFANCTGLVTVSFPKLTTATETNTYGGTFKGCTSLESVQLGSEGYPVSYIGQYMFNGCTQAGLTITVYTNGGAALANEPWGAANATIVYETA